MKVTEYWRYICVRTKRAGRTIELMHKIVNPSNPRLGDWHYRVAISGKPRRWGTISERELLRNWEVLLCNHGVSPEFCTQCTPICPFCANDQCTCSEGS